MSGGPTVCQPSESFLKIGPIANASAGSAKPIVISAPAPCAVPVMKRRRVTVSPSKAPGMPRSAVYLDLLGLRVGANDAPRDRASAKDIVKPGARADQARAARRRRRASPARSSALTSRVALVATPADRAGARAPERLAALALAAADQQRAQRDHVGELAHGLEVAERDEPLEPERVEAVAGQQREIGGRAPETIRGTP